MVGHIPVRVKVNDAIAAGMHTAEHFKAHINDSSLEISKYDWLTPSIDMEMYLTPTFYSYRAHQRGVAARILESLRHATHQVATLRAGQIAFCPDSRAIRNEETFGASGRRDHRTEHRRSFL